MKPWLLHLARALSALTLVCLGARPAAAHSNGIAVLGCDGCHTGSSGATVHLTATPSAFSPGQTVQFALTVAASGVRVGGAYVTTNGVGKLLALPNQGMATVTGGLVHEKPKPASNGSVTFDFAWQVPTTPGNVRFDVSALAANGDGRNSGDQATLGAFDYVFGCTGMTYYVDGDGDGYSRNDATELACDGMPPSGYVTRGGDCDDYAKTTYPGAPELCNQVDDNCDGRVDENAVPVELWPDADSDGYYDERTEKVGTPKLGCAGLKGWAALPGDCNPHDASIHPNATEVCNNIDDDCDGEVDERVRPTCGIGWCRRESPTCDPQYCMPGSPVSEKCNLLDDDCDGLTDEDSDLCSDGLTCASGACVDANESLSSGGSSSDLPNNSRLAPSSSATCGLSTAAGDRAIPGVFGLFLLWLVARRRRR